MRKKIFILAPVAIMTALVIYFFFFKGEDKKDKFTFADITRGDLNTTITSSGTLDAIKKVDVGTQVSGILAKIYVDFNYEVKKGQMLALIDTTFLAAQVRDSKAGLERAQAQYESSFAKHKRNKQLFEKGYLSELDFINSKTALKSDSASLNSAASALERAKTNLSYAFIVAPMSGKIINRNVEQGQTVAASFSTPTLFTITDDLAQMKILATVDESDIGQIKLRQDVQFTVQSYPDKKFTGKVVQVRLNPQVIQNVVNYTIVVNADNSEKLLLPGMTATVEFFIEQKKDVLLIPNSALRFQPNEDLLAEFKKNLEKEMANAPDSIKNRFKNREGGGSGNSSGRGFGNSSNRTRNFGSVWYLDETGKLKTSRVVLGVTDGKNTEIVRGRNLKEGMKVISGIVENNTQVQNNKTNILNPQSNMPRSPRRGF
ncbi:MAG: efflux RND transporter periplasmic adaptor subunit [Ignavibacteriales bacterium]|nr:efflux RND transporter periplasmic adaptor subunit [Ignavibacteriales bacterium]